MGLFARCFRKFEVLLRREKFHRELEEEMAFHREESEREFATEGMASQEARHAARRRFGNDLRLREQSHETVGFWFEGVLQDFRFALRQLRKNPGFAVVTMLVLALGLCACISVFVFVDAALIKPLPYQKPSRLVALFESISVGPQFHLSYLDYLDWKNQNHVFSSLDAYDGLSLSLTDGAGVLHVDGVDVSAGFFGTLGVAPILGRDFRSGEDQPSAPRTVILSYAAWQKRFGGKENVLGKTVVLDSDAYTVIGVLPKDFHFAVTGPAEFWRALHRSDACAKDRGCHGLFAIARLKDSVSIGTASAEMTAIADRLAKQYPDSNGGRGALVMELASVITGDLRPILLALLSGAGLLFLIACVNVASLLLVRSEARRHEIAVRGALGASRTRLARQFVSEGLVLVVTGSLLGVVLAEVAMRLLLHLVPDRVRKGMPFFDQIGFNGHALIFCCAVSLIALTIFSVVPILRLSRMDAQEGLTATSRSFAGMTWRRFGSSLITLELATAMVLLVGAGLLGKSLYLLLHVDTGLNPEHLAIVHVTANWHNYAKEGQAAALARQIQSKAAHLPGVRSAAITEKLPVDNGGGVGAFRIAGRPYHGEDNEANMRSVSAGYFATMQARLIRGRYFTDAEGQRKAEVVIINKALARQYFAGEDPIGKQIIYDDTPQSPRQEIVGLIDDIKEGPLDTENRPAIYLPFDLDPGSYFFLVVRTMQTEQSIFPLLRSSIHEVDPEIVTYGETTMSEKINDSSSAYLHRSSAWLVGSFAGIALLLSVVGLYGVVAYSVSQRTREIGVRMALGAQRGSVYRLVLSEAGRVTAVGIGIGLALSIGAAALMRKLLFGVQAWDVPTLLMVAIVLGACSLLACYLPARRAASVNPVEALRSE